MMAVFPVSDWRVIRRTGHSNRWVFNTQKYKEYISLSYMLDINSEKMIVS